MLVLSRYINEHTHLILEDGRILTVTVADVDRNKVRLGFDVPRSIRICRSGGPNEDPPPPGYVPHTPRKQ